MVWMRPPPIVAIAFWLAGCSAGSLTLSGAETGSLPPDMTGRWILATPNAPTCGVEFTARSAGDGAVRPEGGCPGDFYLSRRWRLADGRLVVAGDDGSALGTFEFANGRFAGKDRDGKPLTLTRSSPDS